jgi:hypothetical protein
MPPRRRKTINDGNADFEVVADAAQKWSDQVLQCRLQGHSWSQTGRAEHIIRFHYWYVPFHCLRDCGVTKWEEWTERGLVVAKGMNYPRDEDGQPLYLLEGFGRVNTEGKGALRLESVSRGDYVEVDSGVEYDAKNMPRSGRTIKALKENKQWPSN